MRFSTVALLATGVTAGVVAPSGPKNDTGVAYTTQVVTALTTYCPEPTMLTHNGVTYTITSATTLTITNCPCTISKPVPISTSPVAPVPVQPTPSPAKSTAPYPVSNGTVTYKPQPSGTGATTPSGPKFTGAASHLSAAGAGVAAIAGLVAALL